MRTKAGQDLPMLVVPDFAEDPNDALQKAACQVCLKKGGEPRRALFNVLRMLGCTPPPKKANTRQRSRPASGISASTRSRRRGTRQGQPTTAGLNIQAPARQRPQPNPGIVAPSRDGGGQRGKHHTRQPAKPLRTAMEGPNRAVLEDLLDQMQEQEEMERNARLRREREERANQRVLRAKRRRERNARFGGHMGALSRWLKRMRAEAATSDVGELFEKFENKLTEAANEDPKSRGKAWILSHLQTSWDELHSLNALAYELMIVDPSGKFVLHEDIERLPIPDKRPREIVTLDAFEGVSRPQSWGPDGQERLTGYYAFDVVRRQSSVPVPNRPLGDDEEPRPKIIYPEGEIYGPEYYVHVDGEDRFYKLIDDIGQVLAHSFAWWMVRFSEELQDIREQRKTKAISIERLVRAFCIMAMKPDAKVPAIEKPSTEGLQMSATVKPAPPATI